MTRIGSYKGVSEWIDMSLDDVAYLAVHCTWLTNLNGLHEALVCRLNKLLGSVAHISDTEGFIKIGVHFIFVYTYVQIYDVSFLKGPCIRNSMANAFVN